MLISFLHSVVKGDQPTLGRLRKQRSTAVDQKLRATSDYKNSVLVTQQQ